MSPAVASEMIVDEASGTRATILSGLGFNCLSFCPGGDEANEVLWSLPGFALGNERPSRSGIPLLFPYPGRLRGKQLDYRGEHYVLDGDDGLGNAIHGYALGRPWKIIEQTNSRITGQFSTSIDDPAWSGRWQGALDLVVSYEVFDATLECRLTVHNRNLQPLPFGLGLHPWFRVPVAGRGNADDCIVVVPAAKRYEIHEMLPTGRLLDADGAFDLRHGARFDQLKLDDAYTGLGHDAGQVVAGVENRSAAARLEIAFSSHFTHCVVYTPPHRQAICIEPYTCAPNAYELAKRGIDGGLLELQPLVSAEYWMRVTLYD